MDATLSSSEIRTKVGLVVLLTLVAAGAAFLVSSLLPKSYTAESQVLVGSLTDPNIDQQMGFGQLAQTYAQLATTSPLLTAVIDDLDLTVSTEEVARNLDVRAPVGLSIIRIEATASTAAGATALADAVAEQITELSRQQPPAIGNLATIVQPAEAPTSPSSPRILLNTLVAAALGFGLGLLIALIPVYRRSSRPETGASPAFETVTER